MDPTTQKGNPDSKSGKDENPSTRTVVPKAVVNRISLYLRELQQLLGNGEKTISSTRLGRRLGISAAQVRKDFAYFGQFGHPGVGYHCEELVSEIRKILGTDRVWPVVLVGCGHLGQALLGYQGFREQGFRIVGAFDIDPEVVGRTFEGLEVRHLDQLQDFVKEQNIRLGVLAVPATKAQEAASTIIFSGIMGILNFAPVTLKVPSRVSVIGVDLAMELEQLAFSVVKETTLSSKS